jgi:hypothetical protein
MHVCCMCVCVCVSVYARVCGRWLYTVVLAATVDSTALTRSRVYITLPCLGLSGLAVHALYCIVPC